MKEFKGTKGPWKWNGEDYRGDCGWQILVGAKGEGILIGEAPEGIYHGLKAHNDVDSELCMTGLSSVEDGAPSVHVRYHNAQLIKASPDLLSALQHLVEVYDSEDGKQWTTKSRREALANARAAIDKALGE